MVRSLCALGTLAALAGCPHPSPVAPPRAATYDVAVVNSSAARVVTSVYTLDVERVGAAVWTFRTAHSEGTWEERGSALLYDSSQVRGSDPWPLSLQHAVSSVPASVRLDDSGAPAELLDEDGWRAAASGAVHALDMPAQAGASATSLMDPAGLVRDLRRSFPGEPGPEGAWTRQESIAGVPSTRVELCQLAQDGSRRVWTCEGTIQGALERVRLDDARSTSVLEADSRGLLRYETTYEGVLVLLDPAGRASVQRAVVGRRLVSRR